jgi:hypothetical protein
MNSTKTNDFADLTKFSLSTFLNIGLMTHYRVRYLSEKASENDGSIQVSASALNQNRDKMIYHACLAGLGALGLLAIGISGLNAANKRDGYQKWQDSACF